MKNTRIEDKDKLTITYFKGVGLGNGEMSMLDSGNELLTFIFQDGIIELTFWELMAMQELWCKKQREDIIK